MSVPNVPAVLDAKPIELEVVVAPSPVVLCDRPFVATLTKVEREVELLVIDDEITQQFAADLLGRLTTAGTRLDTARLEKGAPYRLIVDRINDAAKPIQARIVAAKKKLSTLTTNYAWQQQEKARIAREEQEAEVKRLEALAKKEQEELDRKAKELEEQAAAQRKKDSEAAAKTSAPVLEMDGWDETPAAPEPAPAPAKTETQVQLEQARHAPVAAPSKAIGVRLKTRLIFTVTDVNKLPEPFVVRTANDKAIRDTYCTGYKEGDPLPEVDGILFSIEKKAEATGRSSY